MKDETAKATDQAIKTKLEDITTIANIGTGTMGHAIALQFAIAGYDTRLVGRGEASLARAMERIRADAETFASAGLLREGEDVRTVLSRLTPVVGYERGVTDADFVIESVAENLDVKREVWAQVERHAPSDAVFATNTSGLSPTAIARVLERPERFVAK